MRKAILPVFLGLLGVCYVVSNVQILKSARGERNPAPAALGLPRQSERVVLIVLDGVPVRVAYDKDIMPFLVEISGEGASGVLRAPEETTTPAGVRALATGQTTSAADMLDMFRESEYTGWTVYDDVLARGETVGLSGDKAWTSLLASRDPDGVQVTNTETRLYQNADLVLAAAAARLESAHPPSITVVHLSETDRLGHLYGTRSAEYKTRMRNIDAQIRIFVNRVVPENGTLVITADHGNDVFGSHGGEADIYRDVPIIMAGQGVKKGAKITMDSRALPGVLAVFLGTRIPTEMQAVIPVQAFAMNTADASTLVRANARQLESLAAMRHAALPAAVSRLLARTAAGTNEVSSESSIARESNDLSSVVSALDLAAPPSNPRMLWALVLVCALLVVGAEALWPEKNSVGAVTPLLSTAGALLALGVLIPRLTVPTLVLALGIELAALTVRAARSSWRSAVVAIVVPILVVLAAAARFAYMPQIKSWLHLPAIRAAVLLSIVAGAVALLVVRSRRTLAMPEGVETLLTAAALLGIAMLVPFPPIPSALVVVSIVALRSAGMKWTRLLCIASGLAAFFFLSERLGFAYTGEARLTRYAYVAVTCGLLTILLLLKAGAQRRQLVSAWVCLAPIWPFGYLKIVDSTFSPMVAGMLVVIPVAIIAWVASTRIRAWWAYVPLVTAVAYQLHPTHPFFWVALTVHLAVLGAVAGAAGTDSMRPSVAALTAMSGLVLMSPSALAPSIVLLSLGLLAATRVDGGRLSPATALLFGAALVVFSRYAVVGVFSHGPGVGCTLKCIDEASGFLGFDDTRWTWASGLVTLKMLFASLLVISIASLNRAFSGSGRSMAAATMLVAFAFIAKAAMESALSFGPRGARLGVALSEAGYSAIILLALGIGYVAFALLIERRRAEQFVVGDLIESAA